MTIDRIMTGVSRFALVPAVAAMAMASAQNASAQPRQIQSTIEEITVTARKVEENLQATPVSVSAFSQTELEKNFGRDIQDLEALVPGLIIDPVSAGPGGGALSIRGVSFQDIEKTDDPAIGVHIDGVYIGTNTAQLMNTFDLEAIEVLRGPQGVLFGKNTLGGTINLRRTRPTGEYDAKVQVRTGSYERLDLEGVVNFPLIDGVLAGKFAAYSYNDEGRFDNTATGGKNGGAEYNSFVPSILFTPSDEFELYVAYEHNRDRSDLSPVVNRASSTDLICGVFGQCGTDSADLVASQNFPNVADFTQDAVTAEFNMGVGSWGTLTGVTGWRDHTEEVWQDFDATAIDFFSTIRDQDYEQFSQELRLTSDLSDDITLISGLYYWYARYELTQRTFFPLVQPTGALFQNTNQATNSWAGFLSGDWQINDAWRVSAGIRYTYEKKEFTTSVGGNTVTGLAPYIRGEEAWGEYTPKVSVDYVANDDLMFFGSYARGFTSGGFNGRAGTTQGIGPYDPQFVDNFELGMKSEWLDNKVRFNATTYYMLFTDKHEEAVLAVPPPVSQETVKLNVSEATIYGIELEGQWFVTDGFSLRGAASYNNAEFDEFFADLTGSGTTPTDNSNLELRRAPEFTASLAADYDFQVGDGIANLNVQGRYTDSYFTEIRNNPLSEVEAVFKVDASASYDFTYEDTDFKVTVFGRNLTDEVDFNSYLNVAGLFAFSGVGQERTWGAELRASF